MNTIAFRKEIIKSLKFYDLVNYAVTFFFFVAGEFLLAVFVRHAHSFSLAENFSLLLFSLLLLSFSAYGFWIKYKTNWFTKVCSDKPVSEKQLAIESYLCNFKIVDKQAENNVIKVRFRNKYSQEIDARFYLDESQVLFSAWLTKVYSFTRLFGFVMGKRISENIDNYIQSCLKANGDSA